MVDPGLVEDPRMVVDELLSLCLQRLRMDEDAQNSDLRFAEVLRCLEAHRKHWLQAELDLKRFKELLVKSDVAKAALEVKLKHTRNQLDVEMKKRYKIEADYQYLQRQMQLMCDILVSDSKSSACLNDEQKSLLATFEHKAGNVTVHRSCKRLSAIDESSFLSHSDISYDRTDDDMDLDTTVIKPLKSRPRERRRSSMGAALGVSAGKRGRGASVCVALQERKSVEAFVRTPEIHMVVGITQETPESSGGVTQECAVSVQIADQTSVWSSCDETVAEPEPAAKMEESVRAPPLPLRSLKHIFLSKTVIRPETCSPCGKRIRFGKMVVKCRNCRVVAHPECRDKCVDGCSAGPAAQPVPVSKQNSLESYAPVSDPRVPLLVVECVNEIERRGLEERGLYRVPGPERLVKELREKYIQRKTALMLSKVDDVHVVCGLLKDFLRKLKEPLITFRLHRTFMDASEMADGNSSSSILCQAIRELPRTNRDTLAFLMLHLQKVTRSPQCQMDQNNLARVFGPTIVGHAMSDPSPTTIVRDTNTQHKVVCRLLSLSEEYWRQILTVHHDQMSANKTSSQEGTQDRLFKPLTSPELSSYCRGSLRGRIGNLGNAFTAKSRAQPGRRFFPSPS
ncbi:rac GTPase-activating protein 1 [Genypterus blacodes]|uniref:rac GTPase-activating protein 1 n=1 Tax=Genypterus blacodes TaxID=154954 RepID=UPI003F76A4BD